MENKNALIFDFMGCIHSQHEDIDKWEMDNLKYHSSWDLLIPVYSRVRSKIKGLIPNIECGTKFGEFYDALTINKIHVAYQVVCQLIEYLNKQNNGEQK